MLISESAKLIFPKIVNFMLTMLNVNYLITKVLQLIYSKGLWFTLNVYKEVVSHTKVKADLLCNKPNYTVVLP